MARFLALDWDQQQLHIVSATVTGGSVRIQRAAVWQEQQSPNPLEAEALGQLLRERLKASGIAPAPLLACIGRDRLILKEVRYPSVPAHEEPGIVRFQAVKELTEPPEEVVIDYTHVGEPANGEQRALALAVRREMLLTYQNLCKAAGVKLVALTPRPFGILACLKRQLGASVLTPAPEPPDAAVGVLTATERWAEFSVVRGDSLLFARSLAVGPGLAGEVRRNLAVYTGQMPQFPARALYVAGGGEHAALRERLQGVLSIPVHSFDPFGGVEQPELPATNRGAFAGAVGLLQAHAERRAIPINFAKPKEPKPPRDPNKKRLVIAAGIAAALVLGTVGFCYAKLDQKQEEVESLYLQNKKLDTDLVQYGDDAKRIKALDDWRQANIVWLDELYDLTDSFPDPNAIRLTNLTGVPLQRSAKEKHVAKMSLKGITSEEYQAIDTLMNHLVADAHYRVEPKQLNNNTGVDRLRFRRMFTTAVDIEKQPPDKYTRRLSVPPPESDRRRGPGRRGNGTGMPNFGFGFDGGQQ